MKRREGDSWSETRDREGEIINRGRLENKETEAERGQRGQVIRSNKGVSITGGSVAADMS